MPTIERLGHVGLYVRDIDACLAFYRDVLGLTVTDYDAEHGLAFLSSHPDEDHHELVLCRGGAAEAGQTDSARVQQVSFRCRRLQDVVEFYAVLRERDVNIEYTVTHGNAIGVYFFDPEGNRCEVYWRTGLEARQGFRVAVDLSASPADLMSHVAELVRRYGTTGVIEGEVT